MHPPLVVIFVHMEPFFIFLCRNEVVRGRVLALVAVLAGLKHGGASTFSRTVLSALARDVCKSPYGGRRKGITDTVMDSKLWSEIVRDTEEWLRQSLCARGISGPALIEHLKRQPATTINIVVRHDGVKPKDISDAIAIFVGSDAAAADASLGLLQNWSRCQVLEFEVALLDADSGKADIFLPFPVMAQGTYFICLPIASLSLL